VTRRYWFVGLLLVLAAFAVAASMYSSLPDPLPSHWDIDGRINGTMPKPWGAFLVPGMMLVMWALFAILPRVSPRGFEMDTFTRAWAILSLSILGFMLFVEVLTLRAGRDSANLSPRWIVVGIGVLFAVVGNFLGKVTRNFFAGIRTPWTLASEEVWHRTHRLAGKLFVAAGVVIVVAAFAGASVWALIAAPIVAAVIPAVYSYVIYRRIEGLPARRSA
jgi:uncharacterized membrane protein